MDLKRKIFTEMDALKKPGAILATNTSALNIDENRRPNPSDITAPIIRDISGAKPSIMCAEEIIENCIYPMINEAAKILEENKVQRPSDVDVVWINGYGWPADKGGPMFYGDRVGALAVLARMEMLGVEDAAFSPADTLRKLAASGGKFTEIDNVGLKG